MLACENRTNLSPPPLLRFLKLHSSLLVLLAKFNTGYKSPALSHVNTNLTKIQTGRNFVSPSPPLPSPPPVLSPPESPSNIALFPLRLHRDHHSQLRNLTKH